MLLTVFLVVTGLLPTFTWAVDRLQLEKELLDAILAPDKYDPAVRPTAVNGTDAPVVVKVNSYIRSISELDDEKMEYKVQLTFRQNWKDPRLAFDDRRGRLKYLTVKNPLLLWIPDTFFSNEKDAHMHNIITPNVLLRIKPDGDVLYSVRISMTLACPMNLKSYPMDSQVCSIIFAIYAYTTEDIILVWKEGDPVQITKHLHVLQFALTRFETDTCTSRTNTGEYSCLKVNLEFERQLSTYLVRIYIPFTMLVLLSWLPFWMDYRATMVRMAMWFTILVIMTVSGFRLQTTIPAASYTKAIDVWVGTCLTFQFAAVIALVLVMHCVQGEDKQPLMAIDDHADKATDSSAGRFKRWISRYKSRGLKIDMVSRFAFPLAFALFNLFYWSTYLAGK